MFIWYLGKLFVDSLFICTDSFILNIFTDAACEINNFNWSNSRYNVKFALCQILVL